jgi:hypothetical protein
MGGGSVTVYVNSKSSFLCVHNSPILSLLYINNSPLKIRRYFSVSLTGRLRDSRNDNKRQKKGAGILSVYLII